MGDLALADASGHCPGRGGCQDTTNLLMFSVSGLHGISDVVDGIHELGVCTGGGLVAGGPVVPGEEFLDVGAGQGLGHNTRLDLFQEDSGCS